MGTTFCVKNRIIKLFPKFIELLRKKFDISESNKRERKYANYAVKEKYDEKELGKFTYERKD